VWKKCIYIYIYIYICIIKLLFLLYTHMYMYINVYVCICMYMHKSVCESYVRKREDNKSERDRNSTSSEDSRIGFSFPLLFPSRSLAIIVSLALVTVSFALDFSGPFIFSRCLSRLSSVTKSKTTSKERARWPLLSKSSEIPYSRLPRFLYPFVIHEYVHIL